MLKRLTLCTSAVAVILAGCSSGAESGTSEAGDTTTVTATPMPTETLERARDIPPGVRAEFTGSVWENNIDNPIVEAQLICQRLDQGVSMEELTESVIIDIKSSAAYKAQGNRLLLRTESITEQDAIQMIHESVRHLCFENRSVTGTQ